MPNTFWYPIKLHRLHQLIMVIFPTSSVFPMKVSIESFICVTGQFQAFHTHYPKSPTGSVWHFYLIG